jgi:hypothetical protein
MKQMKYINELMGCSCFPDLISLKIFPDGKEITESASIHYLLRNKYPVFDLSDKDVTFISVGDGCTPRTASMFAFRSAWNCFSIDPNMRWKGNVKRLNLIKARAEEIVPTHFKKLVIANVHSHANLNKVCQNFTGDERVVIAIPCCVSQERERLPDFEYEDESIWSTKNKIKVWHDKG